MFKLHNGNCLDVLKEYPDNHFDSVVTDPPYLISFMGKKWDTEDALTTEIFEEILRVLKPGGHLLSFGATRTFHRMVVMVEDAGFEIRDTISWVYGSGFPKSHNISLAIDKQSGFQPTVIGEKIGKTSENLNGLSRKGDDSENSKGLGAYGIGAKQKNTEIDVVAPTSNLAKEWEGWGTGLKPAMELITVARKPIKEKTIAENVVVHGTGAINIDECRVDGSPRTTSDIQWSSNAIYGERNHDRGARSYLTTEGRWPANVIHDGSEEVMKLFPTTKKSASVKGTEPSKVTNGIYGEFAERVPFESYGDEGSAARFFYCPKASTSDREEGLEDFEPKHTAASEFRPNHMVKAENGESGSAYGRFTKRKNIHATVKPTDLMAYLCRLVTPKGGLVLDPFMGSGSTGKACMREGFKFVGIDMEQDYVDIAEARIKFELSKRENKTTLEGLWK